MARIGPYEIEEELGRGAMGVVFRGYDAISGRRVAIKVLLSQPGLSEEENAELTLRLGREAAAAGKLSHPNIVTLYHIMQEENLFLVFEYVAGSSLASHLPTGGLDPAQALGHLRQIAAALDHAHVRGVTHRDVKPANILVQSDGGIKLADFGIAHIASQTITRPGMTMGTPAYMAPEQIMAARVDGKADQFSLAAMAYEMIAGRKPFEGPTPSDVMIRIVNGEPPAVHAVNPRLPASCDNAFSIALAKRPEDRFTTCAAFVQELSQCLGPESGGNRHMPHAHRMEAPAANRLRGFLVAELHRAVTGPQPLAGARPVPAEILERVYFEARLGGLAEDMDPVRFAALAAGPLRRELVAGEERTGRSETRNLDTALTALEKVFPVAARVIELKYFGGLSQSQIAEVLGMSAGKVHQDWEFARAWVYCQLAR